MMLKITLFELSLCLILFQVLLFDASGDVSDLSAIDDIYLQILVKFPKHD